MKVNTSNDYSKNNIKGLYIFTPEIYKDTRGYFFESWNKEQFNKYINEQTPWKKDINEAVSICSTSLNAFKIITIYLSPIIPNITKNAYKFLNLENCSFDDVDIIIKEIKLMLKKVKKTIGLQCFLGRALQNRSKVGHVGAFFDNLASKLGVLGPTWLQD